MKLRGGYGGARVRRRKPTTTERLASAFGGRGREVEFGAVDGVYRADERAGEAWTAGEQSTLDLPARVRPTVHVYTAGGRTLALMGALVGQHVDLFG